VKHSCYYIFSLVLIPLLLSCSDPTQPEDNDRQPIIVSGTVNQISQFGNDPADSCKIILNASDYSSITFTNNQGEFIDTIFTNESIFTLRIEKSGFFSIDTLIQINDAQLLNFTIKYNRATVSGKVMEKIQTLPQPQPSDSCKITLISSVQTVTIYSDENGEFSTEISTEEDSLRLILEKNGFVTVDTVLHSNSTQNLNFLINFIMKVSGILYTLSETGTEILPNHEVRIRLAGIWYGVFTSDEGYFEFTSNNHPYSVLLNVFKNGYVIIDTSVVTAYAIDLQLYLIKYISYFPFDVGAQWTYSGLSEWTDGDWHENYYGEDTWILTGVDQDTTWFKLAVDFSGMKIRTREWGGFDPETTYYHNEISEFTISNTNGHITLQSHTGSTVSLFFFFFDYLVFEEKLSIIHPYDPSETITKLYEGGGGSGELLEYSMTKDVGFNLLKTRSCPLFCNGPTLNLIDYQSP
jgi:hypothetical protein